MQILNLSATINVASLNPSINTYRLGEGAGTYEYPELNNKPKINGVTLVGDISSANLGIKTSDLANDSGYISEADIPTATSDLVNDSGFVNATQVQEVVSDAIPSDISYFDNDVGYITNADIGNIPTRTSQLINDSDYITAAEAPVVSVNNMTGAVVLDGSNIEYEQNVSLNSKIDAVEADIPTATSELENDSGFITNANIPTRTSQLVNDSGFVNAQNIPVQSVNGETGAVVLTATDIDYDSNNTVATKIDANAQAIESISSADFHFTPASGVTASSVTACRNDKLCIFSAEIRFTGNANAWTVLGNVDAHPAVSHVLSAGMNTSNGTYLGMVEIKQDGTVRIYPTSAVNNGYVMFSLNYATT